MNRKKLREILLGKCISDESCEAAIDEIIGLKEKELILSRNQFMQFFRDDDSLNQLSNDDREEIFLNILSGNSDITEKLLDTLLSNYSVDNIIVSELKE